MRLIVRKERRHPGAQLRITDAHGMRITCFATSTPDLPIAALELRHRLRARAEDRIRAARSTGLRNLPLHHTAQNKVWLEIVQIALDLLAWIPMLALTGKARLWEPRRLRFSPALRGRTARHHRPAQNSPPHQALALDRRDHRRPRTTRAPAQPGLTSTLPVPTTAPPDPRAVEPGAHPTRQPGHRPAHHPPRKTKRPADSVDGPSRKIEANRVLGRAGTG
ncbi:transposase [Streptomyces sp. NPDC003697]